MKYLLNITKGELNRLHYFLLRIAILFMTYIYYYSLNSYDNLDPIVLLSVAFLLVYCEIDIMVKRARQISNQPYLFAIFPVIAAVIGCLEGLEIYVDESIKLVTRLILFVINLRLFFERKKAE